MFARARLVMVFGCVSQLQFLAYTNFRQVYHVRAVGTRGLYSMGSLTLCVLRMYHKDYL